MAAKGPEQWAPGRPYNLGMSRRTQLYYNFACFSRHLTIPSRWGNLGFYLKGIGRAVLGV